MNPFATTTNWPLLKHLCHPESKQPTNAYEQLWQKRRIHVFRMLNIVGLCRLWLQQSSSLSSSTHLSIPYFHKCLPSLRYDLLGSRGSGLRRCRLWGARSKSSLSHERSNALKSRGWKNRTSSLCPSALWCTLFCPWRVFSLFLFWNLWQVCSLGNWLCRIRWRHFLRTLGPQIRWKGMANFSQSSHLLVIENS